MSFSIEAARLIHRDQPAVLHALGPTVELLTNGVDDPTAPGLIRGSVPPGHVIPLHAHDEPETFFVLSGTLEAAALGDTGARWIDVTAGGVLHVPPRARHAFRNTGAENAVALIVTTPSMIRFFERVGVSAADVDPAAPPDPAVLENFLAVVAERGDWNGSPSDNAAIGLVLGS